MPRLLSDVLARRTFMQWLEDLPATADALADMWFGSRVPDLAELAPVHGGAGGSAAAGAGDADEY